MTVPITAVQTQPSARDQDMQHNTNMIWDADGANKCYANIDTISKLENKDKPTVIDQGPNTINCFLPGPNQDNDKRVSAETTQQ